MATSTTRVGCTLGLVLVLAIADATLAASGPGRYLGKPDNWFASDEAKEIAGSVLSHQTESGGWPKNRDSTLASAADGTKSRATFDNGATTDELRFLARIYDAAHEDRYRAAFLKGMDYILGAQYANGGWPQYFPPGRGYHRYITFNDDAMVRLMDFLRETYRQRTYGFVDRPRREAARKAFDRGIQCILNCQIKVDGKRTVWCAQHDEKDFSPRPARTYELVSLSGSESVAIVELLMRIDSPSPPVVEAVEGAVTWFRAAQLQGIRQVVQPDERSPTGKNKIVVKDPSAPPLWARFYEIGTNRPIFADRDGVPKHDLAEIGYERRNGYSWLGNRPQRLLEREYPVWKKKWGTKAE
jgi:PelA/Pel-15E family pectate lyase